MGATPRLQQIALVIGVLASVGVIGYTLTSLNNAYTRVEAQSYTSVAMTPEMKDLGAIQHEGQEYRLVNVIGSRTIPDGRYYYRAAEQRIDFREQPGIGSQQLPAPQALLMSTVINGILNRNLPWGLVLFGVFIVVMMELAGIRSLSFAVGAYLPISTTLPIFAGGLVKWLAERGSAAASEGEVSSGSLVATGLIAGGSIAGLVVAFMEAKRKTNEQWLNFADQLGAFATSNWVAVMLFVGMGAFLYWLARRKLETA